jgi:hypothetical protein
VLYVLALYVAYCGLLFFFQTKLIFPADLAGVSAGSPFLPTGEVLTLETEQGTSVAWFFPAPGSVPGSAPGSVPAPGSGQAGHPGGMEGSEAARPVVVFLHGNAELIDHQRDIVAMYHALGVSVLLPEYRGYGGAGASGGGSAGSPSQAHLVADAAAFYDAVVARPDVDAGRVVIHGRSIGGGVAAQLAGRRACVALIVESTGRSVARKAWGYGVPPFVVRSPFDTERVFRTLEVPVLILHGEHDVIFRYREARALAAAAPNALLVPFDAGHDDLGTGAERARYVEAVSMHLATAGVIAGGAEPDGAGAGTPAD